MIRAFLLYLVLINAAFADNCDDIYTCGKCKNQSEFAWNPTNSHSTPTVKHFYALPKMIETSYAQRDYKAAEELAKEYLTIAYTYKCNWNYGNAIHDGNRFLGLVNYRQGNYQKASEYLIAASKTPGSMQLNSFGPDFDLANYLLRKGHRSAVTTYLKNTNKYWENDNNQLRSWIKKIEQGKTPILKSYSQINTADRYAQGIY